MRACDKLVLVGALAFVVFNRDVNGKSHHHHSDESDHQTLSDNTEIPELNDDWELQHFNDEDANHHKETIIDEIHHRHLNDVSDRFHHLHLHGHRRKLIHGNPRERFHYKRSHSSSNHTATYPSSNGMSGYGSKRTTNKPYYPPSKRPRNPSNVIYHTTRKPVYYPPKKPIYYPPSSTKRPYYPPTTTKRTVYYPPSSTKRPYYPPSTSKKPIYYPPKTTKKPYYPPTTTKRTVYYPPSTTQKQIYYPPSTTQKPTYYPSPKPLVNNTSQFINKTIFNPQSTYPKPGHYQTTPKPYYPPSTTQKLIYYPPSTTQRTIYYPPPKPPKIIYRPQTTHYYDTHSSIIMSPLPIHTHTHYYIYKPPQKIIYATSQGKKAYPVFKGNNLPNYVYVYKMSDNKYGNLLSGLALYNLALVGSGSKAREKFHMNYRQNPNDICVFFAKPRKANADEMAIDCAIMTYFIYQDEKTRVIAPSINETYVMLPNGTLVSPREAYSLRSKDPVAPLLLRSDGRVVYRASDSMFSGNPVKTSTLDLCMVGRYKPNMSFKRTVPCDLLEQYERISLYKGSAGIITSSLAIIVMAIGVLFVQST